MAQPTKHLFWDDESEAQPIRATRGVDQGCPLSPALFAIGLAESLERIQTGLAGFAPTCKVFSYLDDVYVVVPSGEGEKAMDLVVGELTGIGLTVNAGKTAA